MAGALALSGVVSALRTAVCGPRPAQRAAVASTAAAGLGRRAPTLLLAAGHRVGALRGAAAVCSASADDIVEVELKVDGMVCDGCSSRVAEALQKLPGVKQVQ
jgi:hypothetical protein